MLFRVNWLIHNFLQRDPTTRSLHTQSCDLSSRGSLHVATNNEITHDWNETGPLETVSGCFNAETRRCSSGMTLEPLDENLRDVRKSSRSSLNVPGNIGSARRLSEDVEVIIAASPPGSSEICLEIPQADNDSKHAPAADTGDTTIHAAASDGIHYSDSSLKGQRNTNENVNVLVTSSLSPSLGAVHIMRPLAGVAWTKNRTEAITKSRSSLRSFLKPKMQTGNEIGSQSAPSSPVSSRSAKF